MTEHKIIGIPGWLYEGRFGVSASYMNFVSRFGIPFIMTPEMVMTIPKLDLLILPGGADISPSTYGQIPDYKIGISNPMLEYFDKEILPEYIENGTPIFSICRGAQRLWTMYGGHLIQDNPFHTQSATEQCHTLNFTSGNYDFSKMIGKVSSRHHQTMDGSGDNVPEELEIIAYANERINTKDYVNYKVVEIFKHRHLKMVGVQYHPEDHDLTDRLSSYLLTGLLEKE